MSYEIVTEIAKHNDRLKIQVGNCDIWTKTIDFYERDMKNDHTLKQAVIKFRAEKGL